VRRMPGAIRSFAPMTLRSKVLAGLFWTGGARLGSQLITWAITIVVIRTLSPSDYGLLAMATVFVNFLVLMAEVAWVPRWSGTGVGRAQGCGRFSAP